MDIPGDEEVGETSPDFLYDPHTLLWRTARSVVVDNESRQIAAP